MDHISIVILNWNGKEDTMACLERLSKRTDDQLGIVVVDNGSTDSSVGAIHAAYPHAHVIETGKNLGYSGGNNVGIRYALEQGADFVAVLNNDTIVGVECMYELVKALKNHPQAVAASPKIYFYDQQNVFYYAGGSLNWWQGTSTHRGYLQQDHGQFDQLQSCDRLSGTLMMIRREALEHIGLFDERYFLYWEETDWCVRAQRMGYSLLYVPQAKLWHKESSASGGSFSPLSMYYLTRNKFLFLRLHATRLQFFSALIYDVCFTVKIIGSMVIRQKLTRASLLALSRAHIDAFVGKFGQQPLF